MPVRLEVIPKSEVDAKALPQDSAPAKPYVLVVDDENIIADTLVLILRQHGYAADAAYDGASALEMMKLIPPDLLITDVAMPGMTGVDLAIAVRTSMPECRVLLFSGHASTSDLLRSAEEAGYTFTLLSKPVHPRDLLAQTSTLVDAPQPDVSHTASL
ncbi:MAG TPA: response regulator [Terriglobales bacterium]